MQSTSIAMETDGLRNRVHGMWAAVAAGWGEHAEELDARGAIVAECLLDATRLQPGNRVLELASGPGGVGLAAAPMVAPGEVVVSDVVEEMVAIAEARARALGLANVSGRVLDLERIDEPAESYDVVLCREGLMFAVEPDRAARELCRVLRPGGRAGIAVWGPRERNPWLALVFDAVSARARPPGPAARGARTVLARGRRRALASCCATAVLPASRSPSSTCRCRSRPSRRGGRGRRRSPVRWRSTSPPCRPSARRRCAAGCARRWSRT